MTEKVVLKVMQCPTCGAGLKAQNGSDAIVCVYCGNTIVPVSEAPVSHRGISGRTEGTLRIEGIKTPSSALAYMESFFEEYDWDAFAYAQTLSVSEIDELANSLKATCADDKNTWLVCFNAISVPFFKKVEGCDQILAQVVEEYKKDGLDAYSKFDAYKRVSTMILEKSVPIIESLERIIAKATKYGASQTEIDGMQTELAHMKELSSVRIYSDIEEIAEIQTFNTEKNERIASLLASEGIDAAAEYARAQSLIDGGKYVEALYILESLRGFLDSAILIEQIDRCYLISDVMEIEGKLYYLQKTGEERPTFALHSSVSGKVEHKPLITGIAKVISNYADVIYYLDISGGIKQFNLSNSTGKKVYDGHIFLKKFFVYGNKVFLIEKKGGEPETAKKSTVVLDLATGTVAVLLENVKSVLSLTGNKMIYTVTEKAPGSSNGSTGATVTSTNVINVDTREIIELGTQEITVEGFLENSIVYTKVAPNDFNKDLYTKSFSPQASEILIERNIYKFCDGMAGKLFYYIGNSHNCSLISVNADGTERREWPLYISSLLFEQGGWVYFVRKAGYNAILCRARLDGSEYTLIASAIDQFITIKNGYLYYIDDNSTLIKVRLDGSNLQHLCDDVESVLVVKENKIVFVSVDGRIKEGSEPSQTVRTVKSIYAVDFTGGGKIKLAYDITEAKKYDDDKVYYIAAKQTKSSSAEVDGVCLYSINVETYDTQELLELKIKKQEEGISAFAIAMMVMLMAFFFGIIGLAGNAPGVFIVGMSIGCIALLIGVSLKLGSAD